MVSIDYTGVCEAGKAMPRWLRIDKAIGLAVAGKKMTREEENRG